MPRQSASDDHPRADAQSLSFSDVAWYAVLSKPGQQQVAAAHLARQGYRVFLPMCLVERRNGDHGLETVERPLFGRYVFVGVGDQSFAPLRSTIGVQCVVCGYGLLPVQVPAVALRRVAKRLEADGGVVDLRPARPTVAPLLDWEPGRSLEVIDGPFRDLAATLLEWADKRHEVARVVVELFGRSIAVEAPARALRPVARAA